jgi:hypothetical protein
MREFLKKIQLLEHHTIQLAMPRQDFVNRLRQQVDDREIGIFADSFDVFTASENDYKGQVSPHGFRIKRRRRLFDLNMNLAIASGTLREEGDLLFIDTEINGMSGMMIPFVVIAAIIYVVAIGIFFIASTSDDVTPAFFTPILLLQATLLLAIPYFLMRSSVRRLKRELEREFYFLTKP